MVEINFKNLPVLLLGLGVHGGGVAVARWLLQQGAQLTISDLKSRAELVNSLRQLGAKKYRLVLGSHPLALLDGCQMIVQNPGVPANLSILQAARQKKINIENEASLFLKLCPSTKLIAITGSKGKSTTTSLLGAIIKLWQPNAVVAGNIRDVAMFSVLDKIKPTTPVVLELSSWQLELVGRHKLRIPLAVITNVLPDHLNRYRSFLNYTQAKAQIFRWQDPGDQLILNYDNLITRQMAMAARGLVHWFSVFNPVERGVYVDGPNILVKDAASPQVLFRLSDLKMLGQHNLANALAAALAAYVAGVPVSQIRQGVKNFTGLRDRLELVREWRGVKFYNDTTATAPAATQAALAALAGQNITLIAGGADKKLDYGKMAAAIKKYQVGLILLPGTATVKLQAALRGYKSIFLARTMAAAVKFARLISPPGGTVLLSPGAASFGLFKHEFDRGEQFVKLIKALK